MKFDLTSIALFALAFFFFGLTPAIRYNTMNLVFLVAIVYIVIAMFFPRQMMSAFFGLLLAYTLKSVLPYQYRMDGFRDVDCQGITCPEGKFCKDNQCKDIAVGGPVPEGNE